MPFAGLGLLTVLLAQTKPAQDHEERDGRPEEEEDLVPASLVEEDGRPEAKTCSHRGRAYDACGGIV